MPPRNISRPVAFDRHFEPDPSAPLPLSWLRLCSRCSLGPDGSVERHYSINMPSAAVGREDNGEALPDSFDGKIYHFDPKSANYLALTDATPSLGQAATALLSPLLAQADALAARFLGALRDELIDEPTMFVNVSFPLNLTGNPGGAPKWDGGFDPVCLGLDVGRSQNAIVEYRPFNHYEADRPQKISWFLMRPKDRRFARYRLAPWPEALTRVSLLLDETLLDFIVCAQKEIDQFQAAFVRGKI